ncbi:MAG: hypothetical protein COX32_02310 [Candidatus Moranbacteria bacterium CG23_combo_of_CG06-09_8_20_14_all_41_28]|nr:MAG: hypothetical protein COX32_02310 [Candidatus Moranbacteria bacterium CG23_combo_of_CG06-09_8_20_14_all_41_28]
MAYVVPSPLVYQELLNSGGVANSTPDLDACIIGPAFNVIDYVAGDVASLIKTAASKISDPITVTLVAGSDTITFTSAPAVTVGDVLLIPGAGLAGSSLQATVESVNGMVVVLDTVAITSVVDAAATKQGALVDSAVTNTFVMPSQKPGQVTDVASINVYLNNAKVQTLSTNFHAFANSGAVDIVPVVGVASIESGSRDVTGFSASGKLVIGDSVTIVGAGAGGADLVAKVAALPTASTITLDASTPAAVTTVVGAVITKTVIQNISPTTSTLVLEAGDDVVISYTNNVGTASTFETTVNTVVSPIGAITNLTLSDVLPSDISKTTVVSVLASSGATSVTLGSVTGMAVGDKIKIASIGAVIGNDFVSTITDITGSVVTLADALTGDAALSSVVVVGNQVTVSSRKLYNNQLLPSAKISNPLSLNYDTSTTATSGELVINPNPELVYGVVKNADVHVGYRALRTDLSASVMDVANTADIQGTFGDISDANPLALAIQLAKANTTTRVRFIAIESDDLIGYQKAFDLAEGQRLYALVPLTQDQSIIAALKNHAQQMSLPETANWRIALVNTAIPTDVNVGPFSSGFLNANSGNNAIAVSAGKYILTASNATFLSDGVTPGDITHVYNGVTLLGSYTVLEVVSNQQVVLDTISTVSGVSYYVSRILTKTQKAQSVASVSKSFGSNRVIHIQPDTVGVNINGTIKYLPGYYLCAAVAGLVAGFPVQQGFTNIGVAGIADIKYSNFYFTRAQLNAMAEAGTFLFIQETSGSIPYCRHELTTDVTVLEYRELLVVKNWDFLSYFYYDKLKGFMGSWNITAETLNTVRRTIDASSELLKAKKLPKIGAPLIDAKITTLEQSINKDTINCRLNVSVVYPFNYINLYLVI